jgi:hypothetical protein
MRVTQTSGDFKAKAIAGTHTVLIALNCVEGRRKGLKGFAFQREIVGGGGTGPKFLRSQKVFKSVVPDPKNAHDPADPTKPARFYTDKFPVQSFLWGDYAASPGTRYRFVIRPMYGTPSALTTNPADELSFEITTETEWGPGETHGVWFNRGAIASQAFADQFKNEAPKNINDPDDPEVKWLSRGLLEACLEYINETKAGDALRVAAYEFTYPPILNALKAVIDKGIDVQIVYHDTTDAKGKPNETAMAAAGLPIDDQKITYRRSKTKIPHNKFIVRLKGGTDPVEVWTGSTNFTSSGFLGQTNVGHRVADAETAKQYLAFWQLVKQDPELADARAGVSALTPDPIEVIAQKSIAARQARDARLVRSADAQRRELGLVHRGLRGYRQTGPATCAAARPDAFCADGEAGHGRQQKGPDRRPQPRHPVLRHAARRIIRDEERQTDRAPAHQGIRARQVVLQGGAVPAIERRLRVLRPYQVPPDRPLVGRSAGLLGFGQLLAPLADGER